MEHYRKSEDNLILPLGRYRGIVEFFKWTAFTRRFIFYYLPAGGERQPETGRTTGKERYIMTRRLSALILSLVMAFTLVACGGGNGGNTEPEVLPPDIPAVEDLTGVDTTTILGLEDGVLTVGMECAYAPYNWTQMNDDYGAVEISNVPGAYANGYDVMIAKRICEAYGWKLEIVSSEWDSLTPAVQSGAMDANIAGQSMTADRMRQVEMAGPYYYANIVILTTKDSPYANATSIADLAGGRCTSQSGTIWYDTCLPQIPDAQLQSPAASASAMLMALETKTVDFVCTDMPTAMGAMEKNPEFVTLGFTGSGDFQFASEQERAENVNIGIAIKKDNTQLKEAMDKVLGAMTVEHFNELMNYAIAIQPAV